MSEGIFLKPYKIINLKAGGAFFLFLLSFSLIIAGAGAAASTAARIKKLPIYSVKTDEKKLAVSFDAAWSADDTEELIKILKKYDAGCTFFAVGDWLDKNADAAKMLYDNGFEIANHSNTHPAFSKLTREQIKREITDCNEKIKKITGKECRLVRAPSGDYTNESLEVCEELNMKMIQWSVDSLDWKLLSVEEMYSRVIGKAQNGSILLFHNGVKNTPEALDKILNKLKAEGYRFVNVSELIYLDNYKIDNTGTQQYLLSTTS